MKSRPNPLRIDPTGSRLQQKALECEIKRRFRRLQKEITKLVAQDDAFGLLSERAVTINPIVGNVFCPTGKGGGVDPTCSPKSFYHGSSSAVLPKGSYKLLPPSVTGQLQEVGRKKNLDKVFMTEDAKSARIYAGRSVARFGGEPIVYRVIPMTDVGIVQESKGTSVYHAGWAFIESLEETTTNQLTTNAIWEFLTSDQKLQEFLGWLKTQISVTVLAKHLFTSEDHWFRDYISRTFRSGMDKMFDALKKPALQDKLDFYNGTKAQFLESAFGRPVAMERVKLLASRSFNELEAVTDQMATQMQRTLVDGFIKGESPYTIARQLNKDVNGLGIVRAERIARTEVVRALNEGALETMEAQGMDQVGVAVEWSTSGLGVTAKGYPSPCKLCAPLAGVVFSLKEAHGLLPRHPNCRCSFIPAGVGEKTTDQLRTKQKIDAAVARSLKAERGKSKRSLDEQRKRSRWMGATKKIGKRRPKSIV